MHDETDHSEEDKPKTWVEKVWVGFFVLMYPIMMTFSLLFTGLLLVFSTLSKLISWIASLFTSRQPAAKSVEGESTAGETDNVVHPLE